MSSSKTTPNHSSPNGGANINHKHPNRTQLNTNENINKSIRSCESIQIFNNLKYIHKYYIKSILYNNLYIRVKLKLSNNKGMGIGVFLLYEFKKNCRSF
jgi:hypothetical protein